MSDSAALDSAALERRYRRLLAWFPAEHRRTYGEEMIGVLLASAPDGRHRPGPGDIVYLNARGSLDGNPPTGNTVFLALESVALIIAPQPGRGWRVLKVKGLITVVALAGLGFLADQLSMSGWIYPSPLLIRTAVAVVGLALALIFGSGALKRLFALLAIPAYPLLGFSYVAALLIPGGDRTTFLMADYLPTLAIALLIVPPVWRGSRRLHDA